VAPHLRAGQPAGLGNVRVRVVRSDFSDVKAGEFVQVVERRWVGLPDETWLVQALPPGKGEHCARCRAPARRHWFKLISGRRPTLELVA